VRGAQARRAGLSNEWASHTDLQVRVFVAEPNNSWVGRSQAIEVYLPSRPVRDVAPYFREMRIYMLASDTGTQFERDAVARTAMAKIRAMAEERCERAPERQFTLLCMLERDGARFLGALMWSSSTCGTASSTIQSDSISREWSSGCWW
jgi:hypothetical protein